jgi:hypothetical protein
MPAVITFWRLPEEERAFLDYLSSTGDVVAFPFVNAPERSVIAPHPAAAYLEREDPDDALLTLAAHAPRVRTLEVKAPSGIRFVPDHIRSPVIAYKRGKRRDRQLGGSNLATYWSFVDDDGRMHDQPSDFVTWAKKVYRWVRAAAPVKLSAGWRATPAAAAAIKNGLEIMP